MDKIIVNELLREYKHFCGCDHLNRKKLKDYNIIQREIIKDSGIDCITWVNMYAIKYAVLIEYEDSVEELIDDIYK